MIMLLGMGTLGAVVTAVVEDFLLDERLVQQQKIVDRFALSAAVYLNNADAEQLYAMASAQAEELNGRMLILGATGVVQVDSASQLNGRRLDYREVREIFNLEKSESYGFHQITRPEGEKTWAVYYTSLVSYRNAPIGVALLSVSIQDVVDKIRTLRSEIILFLIAVAGAVCLISLTISEIIVHPITEMTKVITRMGDGRFDRRVEIGRFGQSELSEMARAFNTMSAQLGRLEQSRNEFVANASHELKTPLSSMKIMIQMMLLEPVAPEMQQEFLTDIDREIDRLTTIINDLLSLARSDTEHLTQVQRVDMGQIMHTAVHNLLPLATKKKISMEMVVPDHPICVSANGTKLHQVISNLIDNAIKYTQEEGSVEVSVSQSGDDAVFSVRDTGMGISEEDQLHIFDRFYRVDKARSRATGGTGLGLAIVKQIIQSYNGTISVQSKEGEGSVFTVRLPISHEEK